MKKIFGIEAEINVTADEDICKGLGKGIEKGAININDIIKDVKPELICKIKQAILGQPKQDKEEKNTK